MRDASYTESSRNKQFNDQPSSNAKWVDSYQSIQTCQSAARNLTFQHLGLLELDLEGCCDGGDGREGLAEA